MEREIQAHSGLKHSTEAHAITFRLSKVTPGYCHSMSKRPWHLSAMVAFALLLAQALRWPQKLLLINQFLINSPCYTFCVYTVLSPLSKSTFSQWHGLDCSTGWWDRLTLKSSRDLRSPSSVILVCSFPEPGPCRYFLVVVTFFEGIWEHGLGDTHWEYLSWFRPKAALQMSAAHEHTPYKLQLPWVHMK